MSRLRFTRACCAVLLAAAAGCDTSNPVSPTPPPQPTPPTPTTPTTIFGPGVTRAQPATLKFLVQPSPTGVGQPITPAVVVAVLDTLGNVDPAAQIPVTLTIKPYTEGVLHGTTTLVTKDGIATFTGLTVSQAMVNWSLIVSAPGRHWVKSFQFEVSADSAGLSTARP